MLELGPTCNGMNAYLLNELEQLQLLARRGDELLVARRPLGMDKFTICQSQGHMYMLQNENKYVPRSLSRHRMASTGTLDSSTSGTCKVETWPGRHDHESLEERAGRRP
jgi:hypothetical protein